MEIYYCDRCRSRVTENDIDALEALVQGDAVFCDDCVHKDSTLESIWRDISRSKIPAVKKEFVARARRRRRSAAAAAPSSRDRGRVILVVAVIVIAIAIAIAVASSRPGLRSQNTQPGSTVVARGTTPSSEPVAPKPRGEGGRASCEGSALWYYGRRRTVAPSTWTGHTRSRIGFPSRTDSISRRAARAYTSSNEMSIVERRLGSPSMSGRLS
jgi:hypothetical protein